MQEILDALNPFKRPRADTSEAEAAAAEQAEIDRKQKEAEDAINAVFDKYGQKDYDRVRDARIAYEDIELKDQYKDALRELEFALARGGRKGSTISGQGQMLQKNGKNKKCFLLEGLKKM